jgi:cyclic pyranopterin phosphate synthase
VKTFSHLDKNQNPTMVDVSEKSNTFRTAKAHTTVWLPEVIRNQFRSGDMQSKKGPVFQTAIIAGVMAIKQTDKLIPFCHQINIEATKIEIELVGEYAVINCQAKTYGKTGVEMEALVGAQIAALTIYDMCKALSHEMRIEQCRLIEKTGGKNDLYQ